MGKMEKPRDEEEEGKCTRGEVFSSREWHAVALVPALSPKADKVRSDRLCTLRRRRELWVEESLRERIMGKTDR